MDHYWENAILSLGAEEISLVLSAAQKCDYYILDISDLLFQSGFVHSQIYKL